MATDMVPGKPSAIMQIGRFEWPKSITPQALRLMDEARSIMSKQTVTHEECERFKSLAKRLNEMSPMP